MIKSSTSSNHIYASEGKQLWRSDDQVGPSNEVIFGRHLFSDGIIRMETEEDFEEKDATEENNLLVQEPIEQN